MSYLRSIGMVAFVAIVCLSLALSGCGSDSSAKKTADTAKQEKNAPTEEVGLDEREASPAARKAYVRKADRTCQRFNREIRRLNIKMYKVSRKKYKHALEEQLQRFGPILDDIVSLADESLMEFNNVRTPKYDRDRIEGIVELSEQRVEILRDIADAAQLADAAGFTTSGKELEKISKQRNQLAKEYGFKHCARSK